MAAMRRIITGQTAEGKSVFVSDELVEAIEPALMGGWAFHRVWGSDAPTSLPTEGAAPQAERYFPPVGGYRFSFFTIPPGSVRIDESIDLAAALEEVQTLLPGLLDVMEPDHPGMHTTDTVDADVVISGEAWLELDDGAEVHLVPGDLVVQNGTRHRWRNRTEEPCVVFVVLLGAERRSSQ